MQVFIPVLVIPITEGDSATVLGAYTTKELAQKALDEDMLRFGETKSTCRDSYIEEVTLDKYGNGD